jgi:hypothetical protein
MENCGVREFFTFFIDVLPMKKVQEESLALKIIERVFKIPFLRT